MLKQLLTLSLCCAAPFGLWAQLLSERDLANAPLFNSLEEALKDPTKAYRLDLSGKKLSEIPADVLKLTNLQELNLNNNELKNLTDLSTLKHLQILWLSGNVGFNLETAFPLLAKLSNLRELWLRESKYSTIPDNIELLGNLKNLRLLHLGSNELSTVPAGIGKIKTLHRLDIEMNKKFSQLPASIGDIKDLKELDLEDNALTSVPAELGKLKNLLDLDLQGNQINSLPEGLSKLKALKHFNLSGNPLKSLPSDISAMPALEILDLSAGVSIAFNPETYEEVERKVLLELDWVKTFDALSKIKTLKELLIDRSNIKILPQNVGQLKQLQRLDLEENPIDEHHKEELKRWLPTVRIIF